MAGLVLRMEIKGADWMPLLGVRSTKRFALCTGVGAWILLSSCALAQQEPSPVDIRQACGVDQRVDYKALTKYGPWDDRNYEITAEDLDVLAPDEDQLHDPIPAFFRIELRKEIPHLRRTGAAQYPRSAVPLFERRYGGLMQNTRSEADCRAAEPDKPKSQDGC